MRQHKQGISKDTRQSYLMSFGINLMNIKPGWHPDWDRNLGFNIARLLFFAGVTKIEHNIRESRKFDFLPHIDLPINKCNILSYPFVDSSCILDRFKIDKKRPLIWTVLEKCNVGITGSNRDDYTQTSNPKHKNLLADIVLHFNYFKEHFIFE